MSRAAAILGLPLPVANVSKQVAGGGIYEPSKIFVDLRGPLLAGYLSGAPLPLLIALLFIASIPTALLVRSSSELKGGLEVVGLLAVCIALGAFVPLVLVFAYAVYMSVSWYSVTPAESL